MRSIKVENNTYKVVKFNKNGYKYHLFPWELVLINNQS